MFQIALAFTSCDRVASGKYSHIKTFVKNLLKVNQFLSEKLNYLHNPLSINQSDDKRYNNVKNKINPCVVKLKTIHAII